MQHLYKNANQMESQELKTTSNGFNVAMWIYIYFKNILPICNHVSKGGEVSTHQHRYGYALGSLMSVLGASHG